MIYRPRMQAAANRCTVHRKAHGEITRLIEKELILLGYSMHIYGADGS